MFHLNSTSSNFNFDLDITLTFQESEQVQLTFFQHLPWPSNLAIKLCKSENLFYGTACQEKYKCEHSLYFPVNITLFTYYPSYLYSDVTCTRANTERKREKKGYI